MLVPLLLFGLQQATAIYRLELDSPDGGAPRLMIMTKPEARLSPPKLSPKKFGVDQIPFEFDFVSSGYVRQSTADKAYYMRFEVFEQQRKEVNDLGLRVCQMLLRLWDINFYQFHLDHSSEINTRIVDTYLCWGGQAGGEQLFDVDPQLHAPGKVNTIYIYDLGSFADPVEMAREVAHEYGHATLPAVGGFEQPEDWANGYLGEKLFLSELREDMRAGKIGAPDAMSATPEQLDAWLKKSVDPLIKHVAKVGPAEPNLGKKGPEAMNAYIGFVLYASKLLPAPEFAQSLKLVGPNEAQAVISAITTAVDGPDEVTLKIPEILRDEPIWVPTAKGHLTGVTALKTENGWTLIKTSHPTVHLKNR